MNNRWSAHRRKLLFTSAVFFIIIALVGSSPMQFALAQGATPTPPQPGVSELVAQLGQQGARITYNARSRLAHFIGASNRPISASGAVPGNPTSTARGFLSQYGKLFGLNNQAQELTVERQKVPSSSRTFVRFQQLYQGIPVLGGELNVQVNAANQIVSTNGEISPNLNVATTPTVPAATAQQTALALVARRYNVSTTALTTTAPELWIYDSSLIAPRSDPIRLVWRMDVASTDNSPIDELVLVDALNSRVLQHFNQVDTFGLSSSKLAASQKSATQSTTNSVAARSAALLGTPHISIYTKNHATSDTTPGTLICTQANPAPCTGSLDADIKDAYNYADATYNFYATKFGRDSIDGKGLTIVSSVHLGTNYQNAYWNGKQMFYGDGFASADDVVGHELTHGVTQYESGLFYAYESGAIDESLSDVFGEFIDQTDGVGNDDPSVKWLIGEDLPIPDGESLPNGAIRSMSDPTAFGNPDMMTSLLYDSSDIYYDPYNPYTDEGGVHTNSGVNNKAAYLMTDGDTFNGYTITGIGVDKAARVYYEAQTNLLTSGSDYADLYDDLYQGCLNLIGTYGITSNDCQQVRNATLAVEMNQEPVPNYDPEAPTCTGVGQVPNNVFFDNLENGGANFTVGAIAGGNQWTVVSNGLAHSGTHMIYGYDTYVRSDSYVKMAHSVTIPPNSFLRFAHSYDFDTPDYDGGVVEYSTNNGATWTDAGPLFDSNGYPGSIDGFYDNPLAGRAGFIDTSHGYISSRLDLSSLAGDNVMFRWRQATDTGGDNLGWVIDDIQIYSCLVPPTFTSFSPGNGPIGASVTLTGSNFTPVTGVKFNGVTAPFTFVNDNTITTTVPAGATTGPITLSVQNVTVQSSTNFTVDLPPTLTTFSPPSGAAGTSVTITGTHFTDVSSVKFNGTSASFAVNSPTSITTTVPTGSVTGPITVTTPAGIATSSTSFVVLVEAPAGLSATTASQTRINLSWTDNSSTESAFKVEQSLDGTTGWTEIASLAAGTTSYPAVLLDCDTNYYYRVRAYRSVDNAYSPYSNIATALTQTCTLGTPTLLTPQDGLATNNNTPTFTWSTVGTADTYEIEIDNNSNFSSPEQSTTVTNPTYTANPLTGGVVYYWRVRALSNSNSQTGLWSTSRVISIDQQIPVPTLSAPANAANIAVLTPTFSWMAATGATQYKLQVAENQAFSSPAIDKTLVGKVSYLTLAADSLQYGKTYYWHVSAGNASNVFGAWSLTRSFTITNMKTPTNGAYSTTATTMFTWSAVPGATSYTFEVGTDSDVTSVVDTFGPGTALSHASALPTRSTPYYWHIKAVINGTSHTSPAWSLVVTTPLPAAPTLASPATATQTTDTTPTLAWNELLSTAPGYPFSYQIQIATTSNFYSPVQDVIQSGSPYTPPDPEALSDGLYYWRVRTINTYNAAGPWSLVRNFTVDTTPPAAPKLTAPKDWSGTTLGHPTFSWAAAVGGKTYVLRIFNDGLCITPFFTSPTLTAVSYTLPAATTALATGQYCWNVQATDALGNGPTTSATFHFTVNPTGTAPAAPILTAPATGTISQPTVLPDLTWTGVGSKYEVQVDTSAAFTNPVRDAVVTTTNYSASNITTQLPVGVYSWHVRAINASGVAGVYSAVRTFTIISTGPAAPALVTPAQNANITALHPTLTWKAVTGAKSYIVEISQYSIFVPLLGSPRTVVAPAVSYAMTSDTLTYGTTYYWRVHSVDGSGNPGPLSDVFHFTLNAHMSPADGSSTTLVRPTFTWSVVAGATLYQLQVATDTAFTNVVANYTGNLTKYTIPTTAAALAHGTYYWRVTATTSGGPIVMPYWTLTVTANTPGVPVLTTPATNAITNDNTPTFGWKAATNAQNYEVEVATTSTFASPLVVDATTTSGLLFYTPATLPDAKYYWRVRSLNVNNAPSAWSAVWNVTVDTTPPAAPVLLGPATGTTTTNPSLTFRWNAVTGAVKYQIAIGPQNPPTTPVIPLANVTSYLNTQPLAQGVYYWEVYAIDAAGNISAPSAVRSFTIAAGLSSQSIKPTPTPTATEAPQEPPAPNFAPPTNTPSAPQPATAVPLVTVEAESANVVRSGTWTAQTTNNASGGQYLYSSGSTGDTLTLGFSGTHLEIVFVKHPAFGSFAVEVDGTLLKAVDARAAASQFGAVLTLDNLAPGTHVLRIRAISGTVALDAFRVEALADLPATPVAPTATPTQEPATGQTAPQPADIPVPEETPTGQ